MPASNDIQIVELQYYHWNLRKSTLGKRLIIAVLATTEYLCTE